MDVPLWGVCAIYNSWWRCRVRRPPRSGPRRSRIHRSNACKNIGLSPRVDGDRGWVSRKIETSRRREVLSWPMHKEVAVLGGYLLRETERHPPGPSARDMSHDVTHPPPTLEQLHLNRMMAHRWRVISHCPEGQGNSDPGPQWPVGPVMEHRGQSSEESLAAHGRPSEGEAQPTRLDPEHEARDEY